MNQGPLSPLPTADYFSRIVVGAVPATPGLLCVLPLTIGDIASGDVDFVMGERIEIVKIDVIKRNGAGAANTVTVKNAANAITGALACAVDNTVTGATTLDDAYTTIEAGGTLRVTVAKSAGTTNAQVIVYCVIRPAA